MANAGIGNPCGAVPIFDGGVPRTITGYAMASISGGAFVFASGATGVVSSGADSFVSADITFSPTASGGQFTGIAMYSAASGAAVVVATEGTFIVVANGTVNAGTRVACDGNNSVLAAGSVTLTDNTLSNPIGRALTAGASGGYIVVQLGA